MKTIFSKKGVRLTVLVLGLAGIGAAVVVVRHNRHRHDQRMTSSCANHAIQLSFLVMSFVQKAELFPLHTDTRSAFAKMSEPGHRPADWLSSYGSSCPESFLRDNSIGYVFVADGLSTKAAIAHSPLVFFCPAESHQRSEQHSHAVMGDGDLLCIKSNIEMVELLQREIRRAKEAVVPYSANAVAKMEREIQVRQNHVRKREPNKITGANAGGLSQLTIRPPLTARVAQFWLGVLPCHRANSSTTMFAPTRNGRALVSHSAQGAQ